MDVIGPGIKRSSLRRAPYGLGGLWSRIIRIAISGGAGTNGPNGLEQGQPTLVFRLDFVTELLANLHNVTYPEPGRGISTGGEENPGTNGAFEPCTSKASSICSSGIRLSLSLSCTQNWWYQ